MKKIMMITALILFPTVIYGMEEVENKEILVTTKFRNLAKMLSQSQKGRCDDYQQYTQVVNTLKSHLSLGYPLKKKEGELYLFHFRGDADTLENYSDIIQVYTDKKEIEKLKENTESYDQGFFVLVEEPTFSQGYYRGITHVLLVHVLLLTVWTTYTQWSS